MISSCSQISSPSQISSSSNKVFRDVFDDPRLTEARNLLRYADTSPEAFKEAGRMYNYLKKDYPNSALLHLDTCEYHHLNDYTLAAKECQKILQLISSNSDPNLTPYEKITLSYDANRKLCKLFAIQDNFSEAIKYCQETLDSIEAIKSNQPNKTHIDLDTTAIAIKSMLKDLRSGNSIKNKLVGTQ